MGSGVTGGETVHTCLEESAIEDEQMAQRDANLLFS